MLIKSKSKFKFSILLIFSLVILLSLHFFYITSEIKILDSKMHLITKKFSAHFDTYLSERNESKISELLSIINEPIFTRIVFYGNRFDDSKNLVISYGVIDKVEYDLTLLIPINYNNLNLGNIEISINILELNKYVITQYWWLYLANVLILLFAILISNLQFFKLVNYFAVFLNKLHLITVDEKLSFTDKQNALGILKDKTLNNQYFMRNELNTLFDKISNLFESERQAIALDEMSKTSKQVAHDIRSPLAALNIIVSSLTDVPEEKRLLIRNSVQRINDIANDLLQKGKSAASTSAAKSANSTSNIPAKNPILSTINGQEVLKKQNYSFLVSTVVDNIVSEKRIQFREKINVHINVDLKSSFGLFVNANSNELSRVISNLINNSVEALPNQSGNIEVSVFINSDSKVCIQIKDNGSGIPKHILEKLGQAGISHGKENTQSGNGLGVYHAIKTIQEFGGQIKFQSLVSEDLKFINKRFSVNQDNLHGNINVSTGTTILIELPKANMPEWFAESIQLKPGQEFLVVDDDISIHQIWNGRLKHLNANENRIKITSFTSAKEFRDYFKKNLVTEKIFLIDYEFLNQNDNGLKIITDLGIQSKSILVTSRFDEPHILSECEAQKIKMLPKQLAGQISITISKTTLLDVQKNALDSLSNPIKLSKYDLCLIDDDKLLVHSIWGMVAKTKGLNIKMFECPEDFYEDSVNIDKSTPIYVDLSLGNNVNGIEVVKEIHEQGFENINIATGYDSDFIKAPEYVRQIVGKDFPV